MEAKNKDNNSIKEIRKNAEVYDDIEFALAFSSGTGETSHRIARYKKEFNIISKFIQRYNNSEKNIALDIGCSGGRYIGLLLTNGFKPYGVDTSMIALRYAKSVFGQTAAFINASATHLPFRRSTFDIVFCIELLHHIDDYYLEKILKDVSYLIKPGGVFICDVRNSLNPALWYSYRKRNGKHLTLKTRSILKMVNLLKKSGFKVCHKESLFFPFSIFAPYTILFCEYR